MALFEWRPLGTGKVHGLRAACCPGGMPPGADLIAADPPQASVQANPYTNEICGAAAQPLIQRKVQSWPVPSHAETATTKLTRSSVSKPARRPHRPVVLQIFRADRHFSASSGNIQHV